MKNQEKLIFPKGEKINNNYFTGAAWLKMLLVDTEKLNCVIANVTFDPGARNNWHKHPGGQILLVTDGEGYFQEEGKPKQIIKKGDVIKIDPEVKHWHGATENHSMTHVAISTNTNLGDAQWMEKVSNEQYSQ